jgi:hypothetical protein
MQFANKMEIGESMDFLAPTWSSFGEEPTGAEGLGWTVGRVHSSVARLSSAAVWAFAKLHSRMLYTAIRLWDARVEGPLQNSAGLVVRRLAGGVEEAGLTEGTEDIAGDCDSAPW